ncbi:P-loop containing nucleoside triphosphate hydrolase protein [Collybia nuda]|uniref:P-loop containing nucleoside triphosphate hydrolase protein n=1 Tax=Collybia nuda TaxID=64659 RepID=A0A9P5Y8M7_9AGAR|nr:P-loop containing nucleoside triphosphate hydrolase protein [Collybia nuda]
MKHKVVPKRRKAFIAVMGATGSGKSSFVNLVTGSNLNVSKSLVSCTQMVELGSQLRFGSYEVNLIDTPGFDDLERSEVEILKIIAKYLQTLHQSKIKLHGVIFLYRISDIRMSGISRRTLQLFRAICGEKAIQNTMIVTTMWDNVVFKDGVERERQLSEEPFKPFLLGNAKMHRHDKGLESAQHIISLMLRNKPCPLAIQTEMVNDRKPLLETGAGLQLSGEIQKTIHDISNQLATSEAAEEIKTTSSGRMEDAYLDDDEDYERQELLKQLTRYQREMKSLVEEYHAEGGEQQNHQNLRKLKGDIARILRRWPKRFRKNGRAREATNDETGGIPLLEIARL